MTDQTLADKVREIIEKMHHHANDPYVGSHEKRNILIFAQQLTALLPSPPLPTLADMTDEERDGCRWMQADVYSFDRRMVITEVRTMCADLIERDGERWNVGLESVTPRPDLPRMTWPGDTPHTGTTVTFTMPAPTEPEVDTSDTVPENSLAVGSKWGNVGALTTACRESGRTQITVIDCDGDVSVWDASAENWHGPHPIPKYAPYTITHTGRKAGQ